MQDAEVNAKIFAQEIRDKKKFYDSVKNSPSEEIVESDEDAEPNY